MFRRVGFVLLTVVALSSCASDASTESTQASVATTGLATETTNTVASTSAPVTKKDFGSTFIGAPTAFWFWAPY
jgi:hypothetical protein